MSLILDQLTALLATASPADAAAGASIRAALATAEADYAGVASLQASAQTAYEQASAAFVPVRLAAFNAADRTARAAEQALLPRTADFEPDISVPAEFSAADGFATVTLLGFVRVTALESGAYGNLIEAAVLPNGVGFACTVRRGTNFSETLQIGIVPTTGLIAKVETIGPGSLSTTAFTALSGASGGGLASLRNRLNRLAWEIASHQLRAHYDLLAALQSANAALRALRQPNPPPNSSYIYADTLSAAVNRARAFIRYLEVV